MLVQPSNDIAIVTQVRSNRVIKSFSETLTLLSIRLATVSPPNLSSISGRANHDLELRLFRGSKWLTSIDDLINHCIFKIGYILLRFHELIKAGLRLFCRSRRIVGALIVDLNVISQSSG